MNHRIFYWTLLVAMVFSMISTVRADTSEIDVQTVPSQLPVYLNDTFLDSSPVTISSQNQWHKLTVVRGDTPQKLYFRPDGSARITLSQGDSHSDSTSKFEVQSDPSGARIQLNGRKRGQTPWASQVTSETMTLRLKRDGFLPWHMKVVPRGKLSLEATLKRRASVDTKLLRTINPEVKAVGSRSGFQSEGVFRRVIPPPEGSDTGTSGKVARERARGTIPLEIESSPSGALVEVDGREMGRTPLLREKFRRGSLTIKLKKPGYRLWKERVKLTQPTRIKVKLRRE